MDKRAVTAWLVNCEESDLVGFREYGDYVGVLNPAGQKFTFDNTQLEKAEKAMQLASPPDPSPDAKPPGEGGIAAAPKKAVATRKLHKGAKR